VRRAIQQSVTFSASPEELFRIYTDSKKHSSATGSKASVSSRAGAKFTAFEGMLSGQNLIVVPGRMIVQRWRAAHWKKTELDSILILEFSRTAKGGRIDLVHVNVPDHDYVGVSRGWPKYYWKPWKAYLKKQARRS
jgi:uncharacterized protein YndB with AHSA1/START domain